MSEAPESPPAEGETPQEQAFTQADVDRIVRERVARERAKFADYDALKAQAAGAKTVEQQLAEMQQLASKAQREALASRIAAKYGISPDDADLFLTASDEETLTAQAERLAGRDAERRKQGNYVPNEGKTSTPSGDPEIRQFARQLFEKE